jgi:hypothetical protein
MRPAAATAARTIDKTASAQCSALSDDRFERVDELHERIGENTAIGLRYLRVIHLRRRLSAHSEQAAAVGDQLFAQAGPADQAIELKLEVVGQTVRHRDELAAGRILQLKTDAILLEPETATGSREPLQQIQIKRADRAIIFSDAREERVFVHESGAYRTILDRFRARGRSHPFGNQHAARIAVDSGFPDVHGKHFDAFQFLVEKFGESFKFVRILSATKRSRTLRSLRFRLALSQNYSGDMPDAIMG